MQVLKLGSDIGGCQNYGPFLGTLNIRCRIIIGIQKGTIILTTTHMRSVPWLLSEKHGSRSKRTLAYGSQAIHLLRILSAYPVHIGCSQRKEAVQ